MHVLGVGRSDGRVMREATALQQAGWEVFLVDLELDAQRPRQERISGVQLRHIVSPRWYTLTRFKPLFLFKLLRAFCFAVVKMLQTSADIYHAHDYMALPACYLAARLRRKPCIFDAHELPLVEPSETRWRRLRNIADAALKWMVPRCLATITVSPPIARDLQRVYGGSPPVLVRNVPEYQPPVASNRLRQRLGLGAQTRIALYQGNLQRDRGLDRLVRAARFLDPNVRLVLMGRNFMGDELPRLIAEEGVGDRVSILPAVPYAELLEWTASADIGLILLERAHSLNVQMCLPNKLFEYLMAGLPVLASSLDAVAEILETYEVRRVVASPEPLEIGRAINAFLADSQALARLRGNALAAARTDLRWDVESQPLLRLYRRALERSEQP